MSNFNFYPPTSPSPCKKGLKFGAQICAEKLLLCHVKNSEPKLNPFSYNYVMDRRSSVIAEMKVPHKCGYEKLNVYMDGKSTYLDLLHHPFLVKIVRSCNGLLTND